MSNNTFGPSLLTPNPFGTKRNVLRRILRATRPRKMSLTKAQLATRPHRSGNGSTDSKRLSSSIANGLGRFGNKSTTVGSSPGLAYGDKILGGNGDNLGTNGVF